jgi:DNA uptake protein ComE-like DNA-binding protein
VSPRERLAGPATTPAARLLLILLPLLAVISLLPRFASGGHTTPESLAWRINPNTAAPAELALLPRIGPKLAAAIATHRAESQQQPAFQIPDDLQAVHGIGPRTVARLRPLLYFPPPKADPSTEADTP